MSTPSNFLFAPVAAIRPYLFARLFLLMLAVDILFEFLIPSAQYGAGGFDVAHFAWLDAIQPLPSAAIYIPILLVTSFALWLSALAGIHRSLLALAFLLFTYGWAMSQHDSYQHHYLLSLILLCVIFFPKLTTADVSANPRRPVSAWAYVMLAIQMSIVYLWTAIAKMDPVWISGHAVQRILKPDPADKSARESVLNWLLAQTHSWSAFAISAIVFELLLVVGYLYAVGQDRRNLSTGATGPSPRGPVLCAAFLLTALMIHGGILLMNLHIGIFSYYMILAALCFLTPLPWLEKISAVILRPALAISRLRLSAPAASSAARHRILVTALFPIFVVAASYIGHMPYYFYLTAAQANHFVGDPREAQRYYSLAIAHAPNSLLDSQLYNNYADILQQLGRNSEAVANYQAALRLNPADAYAHSNLAKLLMQNDQENEALKHFAKAVEARPGDAELICDLAVALQSRQRIDGAVKLYRAALKADPNLARAANNLAWILATAKDHTQAEALEAVTLATRAAALTNHTDPLVLSTLAETYHAAGMQKESIATAEQAIKIAATQTLPPKFVETLTARLARYKQSAGN